MWTKDQQRSEITKALGHIDSAIRRGAEPGHWPNGCPLRCQKNEHGRRLYVIAAASAMIGLIIGLMMRI